MNKEEHGSVLAYKTKIIVKISENSGVQLQYLIVRYYEDGFISKIVESDYLGQGDSVDLNFGDKKLIKKIDKFLNE